MDALKTKDTYHGRYVVFAGADDAILESLIQSLEYDNDAVVPVSSALFYNSSNGPDSSMKLQKRYDGLSHFSITSDVGVLSETRAALLGFLNDTNLPTAPSGLTATAGNGQATISWNAVSGATSNIYWSTTSGVSKTNYTGKISNVTSPYTHTGLTNGLTYYYVVTAVNSYGESSESSQVSATPSSGTVSDTTAPSNTTASNFINSGASSTSSTSVTLAISATDAVGVTAYYASETSTTPSASASGWTAITATTSYSASVPFTLSSTNGTKTIYVWFKDAVGNVSLSANDSINLSTGSAPSAPTGVSATAASVSQINLTWSASTDDVGVTGYKIYRGGTYLKSASTTTSSDTGLSASTQYCYTVSAYDAAGNESAQTTQVCATTQAASQTTYTLTVSKSGTGSGMVTSSPTGISCGSTCSASYISGTSVILTPSTSSGSTFAGWSGGGCSGTGSCTVTMDASKTVTATFTLSSSTSTQPGAFTLSVTTECNGSSPHNILSWTPSSGVSGYYAVYRCTGTGCTPTLYNQFASTGTTFDNTSVTAGTSYTYFVGASNAYGTTYSNWIPVTTRSICP